MPPKKASLINFRQPPKPPTLDEFVEKDPKIPTPSLPEEPEQADEENSAIEPERHTFSLRIKKTLHKGLKIHANKVEKKLQYLVEDALEGYLDKHWPDWRRQI